MKTPSISICVLSLLLIIPAFIFGSGGGDIWCQGLRTHFFSTQFLSGELYPRWLMDMYAGSGSPVFFFYPPLAYYVSAALSLFIPGGEFYYYPIAASALLAVAASGFTFYLWLRKDTTKEGVLLGSLIYMAAPFHVAHTFYFMMLYSTVWAYAFIPLLLLFARSIALNERYGICGFSFSLGLLIFTNTSATIIAGPLAIAYALALGDNKKIFSLLSKCIIATLLGFSLSAVFLLPAISYAPYVNTESIWNNPYGDQKIFMVPGFSNINQSIYFLIWLAMVALVIAGYFSAKRTMATLFFAVVALLALIMITALGQALWNHIPALAMLQHPARLFLVPTLSIAVLAAFAAPQWQRFVWALLALFLIINTATAWESRQSLDSFQKNAPKQYHRYQLSIDQYSEYLTSPEAVTRFYSADGLDDVDKHPAQAELLKGSATWQITTWQPRFIAMHVDAKTPSQLRVRRLLFPGLEAKLNGAVITFSRDETTGQAIIDLPATSGELTLELTQQVPEVLGKMISLISFSVLIIIFLLSLRRKTTD